MTMTQAAKWAGVDRSTMFKAIRKGRVSARKNDAGEYRIDPAELERAFSPVSPAMVRNVDESTPGNSMELAAKDREIALLREMVTKAERTADDLRTERDRLLGIVESAQRQLTDQRSWWKRLLG